MKKIKDINELIAGDMIQCTLKPEWGFGKVMRVILGKMSQVKPNHSKPNKQITIAVVLFAGKDLFGDISGVKFISHLVRDDIYKMD